MDRKYPVPSLKEAQEQVYRTRKAPVAPKGARRRAVVVTGGARGRTGETPAQRRAKGWTQIQ